MPTPPGKGSAPRPAAPAASKAASAAAGKPGAPRSASPTKSAAPAKPGSRAKPAKSATARKQAGTHGGRLTIAVLAGLAMGLVALLIYGMAGPKTPWAFDRPEARLPSLQSKHTLY